jgi:Ca2+-binding RTX toxin-like protein
VGGSGNDTFLPTGGNNVIMGGTGTNTLDLSLLPSYSTFNLGSAAPQQLGTGDGTLAVVPGTIQTVIASPSGSTLQAGPGNNVTLVGGPGNDWLAAGNAGTGTQTLMATTGNDTLLGGVGNDNLEGGTQAVTFVPGQAGSDTLTTKMTIPGNTLSYATAPSGAQVNLSNNLVTVNGVQLQPGTAAGGWGATVKNLAFAQIDEIMGSPGADTFYTGPAPTTILGNGGNDLFHVTSGGNTLTAGTGPGGASKFRFEGAGSNFINGGGNSTIDFSLAPQGVNVNLPAAPTTADPNPMGLAVGGFGGMQSQQTLTGIQNVIGTNFADVLVGGATGQTLTGMNGGSGDVLQTGPAGGDTLVGGGTGPHTFCAQQGCDDMAAPTGGSTMIGGSGTDDFFAQNGQVDHITGQAGDNAFVDPQDVVTGTGITVIPS